MNTHIESSAKSNIISWALAISLFIVALVIGMGIGYYLTPEYTLSMYEKNMDLGRADRSFDLRYINAMAAHHRGAMLLAEQAQESGRSEITALSKEILANEPKLIAELYDWKKAWYSDTRVARDPQVAQLGQAKAVDGAPVKNFDLRFLNALIAHHEAGIAMAEETKTKSSRGEVLDNAEAVRAFLANGVVMLKKWRADWYGI